MTESEQKVFDIMRAALRAVLLCVPNAQKVTILNALAAANSVSAESKVQLIPTAQEIGTPMQQHKGE